MWWNSVLNVYLRLLNLIILFTFYQLLSYLALDVLFNHFAKHVFHVLTCLFLIGNLAFAAIPLYKGLHVIFWLNCHYLMHENVFFHLKTFLADFIVLSYVKAIRSLSFATFWSSRFVFKHLSSRRHRFSLRLDLFRFDLRYVTQNLKRIISLNVFRLLLRLLLCFLSWTECRLRLHLIIWVCVPQAIPQEDAQRAH